MSESSQTRQHSPLDSSRALCAHYRLCYAFCFSYLAASASLLEAEPPSITARSVTTPSVPIAGVPAPIAHWQLDDAGREARDGAGAHHGVIHGAVSQEGQVGKGLLFDRERTASRDPAFCGLRDRHVYGLGLGLAHQGADILGDPGHAYWRRVQLRHETECRQSPRRYRRRRRWIETKVNFYKDDIGANGQGGDLELRRWYLITFVVDNERKECRLYLDADRKKRFPSKAKWRLMRPGQTMTIGNTGRGEFMDGVIDDVRIWKHALTDEQVRKLIAAALEAKVAVP